MSDLIERQAAIDALAENKEMINAVLDSLTLDYNTRRNQEQRRGQINEDIETIKALPSAQQWIPVTERLPKPNELNKNVRRFYLVQNEYGDMMVASFNKSSASECTWWEQIYQYGEELSDIVAWMPLPKPWEGETDG